MFPVGYDKLVASFAAWSGLTVQKLRTLVKDEEVFTEVVEVISSCGKKEKWITGPECDLHVRQAFQAVAAGTTKIEIDEEIKTLFDQKLEICELASKMKRYGRIRSDQMVEKRKRGREKTTKTNEEANDEANDDASPIKLKQPKQSKQQTVTITSEQLNLLGKVAVETALESIVAEKPSWDESKIRLIAGSIASSVVKNFMEECKS